MKITLQQVKEALESLNADMGWVKDFNLDNITYLANEVSDIHAEDIEQIVSNCYSWEFEHGGGCYERACDNFRLYSSPEQEHNEFNTDY